jgi:putative thymidine phosphorylase
MVKDLWSAEIIKEKLLGKELSYKEIYHLMDSISHHRINNVQMAYYVASSFVGGFTDEELYFLTKAMVETGVKLHITSASGIVADKHSIGGVSGTRASMIVVPIMVSLGYVMPKTSSRAITTPSGTADTMEVLAPVSHSPRAVEEIIKKAGGCIIWGGHLGIAPADDIIIKVEEELGMENYDKILVSILAKKVAMGSTHTILDVPVGPTMKIKTLAKGHDFANKFVEVAKRFNITVLPNVQVTKEPAGYGVGPVLECIDVLHVLEQNPKRPEALEERALWLVAKLLGLITGKQKEEDIENHYHKAKAQLTSGKALATFKAIIKAQGGNDNVQAKDLKYAQFSHHISAKSAGHIHTIHNFNINSICRILGAPKDIQAGIVLHKKIGDPVHAKESLFTLYTNDKNAIQEVIDTLPNFPIYDN